MPNCLLKMIKIRVLCLIFLFVIIINIKLIIFCGCSTVINDFKKRVIRSEDDWELILKYLGIPWQSSDVVVLNNTVSCRNLGSINKCHETTDSDLDSKWKYNNSILEKQSLTTESKDSDFLNSLNENPSNTDNLSYKFNINNSDETSVDGVFEYRRLDIPYFLHYKSKMIALQNCQSGMTVLIKKTRTMIKTDISLYIPIGYSLDSNNYEGLVYLMNIISLNLSGKNSIYKESHEYIETSQSTTVPNISVSETFSKITLSIPDNIVKSKLINFLSSVGYYPSYSYVESNIRNDDNNSEKLLDSLHGFNNEVLLSSLCKLHYIYNSCLRNSEYRKEYILTMDGRLDGKLNDYRCNILSFSWQKIILSLPANGCNNIKEVLQFGYLSPDIITELNELSKLIQSYFNKYWKSHQMVLVIDTSIETDIIESWLAPIFITSNSSCSKGYPKNMKKIFDSIVDLPNFQELYKNSLEDSKDTKRNLEINFNNELNGELSEKIDNILGISFENSLNETYLLKYIDNEEVLSNFEVLPNEQIRLDNKSTKSNEILNINCKKCDSFVNKYLKSTDELYLNKEKFQDIDPSDFIKDKLEVSQELNSSLENNLYIKAEKLDKNMNIEESMLLEDISIGRLGNSLSTDYEDHISNDNNVYFIESNYEDLNKSSISHIVLENSNYTVASEEGKVYQIVPLIYLQNTLDIEYKIYLPNIMSVFFIQFTKVMDVFTELYKCSSFFKYLRNSKYQIQDIRIIWSINSLNKILKIIFKFDLGKLYDENRVSYINSILVSFSKFLLKAILNKGSEENNRILIIYDEIQRLYEGTWLLLGLSELNNLILSSPVNICGLFSSNWFSSNIYEGENEIRYFNFFLVILYPDLILQYMYRASKRFLNSTPDKINNFHCKDANRSFDVISDRWPKYRDDCDFTRKSNQNENSFTENEYFYLKKSNNWDEIGELPYYLLIFILENIINLNATIIITDSFFRYKTEKVIDIKSLQYHEYMKLQYSVLPSNDFFKNPITDISYNWKLPLPIGEFELKLHIPRIYNSRDTGLIKKCEIKSKDIPKIVFKDKRGVIIHYKGEEFNSPLVFIQSALRTKLDMCEIMELEENCEKSVHQTYFNSIIAGIFIFLFNKSISHFWNDGLMFNLSRMQQIIYNLLNGMRYKERDNIWRDSKGFSVPFHYGTLFITKYSIEFIFIGLKNSLLKYMVEMINLLRDNFNPLSKPLFFDIIKFIYNTRIQVRNNRNPLDIIRYYQGLLQYDVFEDNIFLEILSSIKYEHYINFHFYILNKLFKTDFDEVFDSNQVNIIEEKDQVNSFRQGSEEVINDKVNKRFIDNFTQLYEDELKGKSIHDTIYELNNTTLEFTINKFYNETYYNKIHTSQNIDNKLNKNYSNISNYNINSNLNHYLSYRFKKQVGFIETIVLGDINQTYIQDINYILHNKTFSYKTPNSYINDICILQEQYYAIPTNMEPIITRQGSFNYIVATSSVAIRFQLPCLNTYGREIDTSMNLPTDVDMTNEYWDTNNGINPRCTYTAVVSRILERILNKHFQYLIDKVQDGMIHGINMNKKSTDSIIHEKKGSYIKAYVETSFQKLNSIPQFTFYLLSSNFDSFTLLTILKKALELIKTEILQNPKKFYSASNLEKEKRALLSLYCESNYSQLTMFVFLSREMSKWRYDFTWKEKACNIIRQLRRRHIIQFYSDYFTDNSEYKRSSILLIQAPPLKQLFESFKKRKIPKVDSPLHNFILRLLTKQGIKRPLCHIRNVVANIRSINELSHPKELITDKDLAFFKYNYLNKYGPRCPKFIVNSKVQLYTDNNNN
ncbi:uncharacterized protein CMU_032710 [Cryptosporidium muris RN66]|uniref:Uncharacterized protein n=1 Tax=Cryptosporidium muris (strain RN66) TaxID=441375 RepID=B6AF95_CRYMR|nr:uncharacterized protein CMU_032710 [Cryptosporidium muris RN66]EEA06886.1 hypothetical protein, conserved [Cryptosporidium muris RN66]|eukprot:XP_002141235.1 hypothetical protein [Cryptosporidium muris RN66]